MTEQEKKMWQDDLDMIAKLNKEVDELLEERNKLEKKLDDVEEFIIRYLNLNLDAFDTRNLLLKLLEILKGDR